MGLYIRYCDASGEDSERRIACRRIDVGDNNLHAWCFEREAPRRFKLDRIVSAACTETGELFDLGELVELLRLRGLPTSDSRLARIMTLMVFLMRCDREAHHTEFATLEAAATCFALRFGGDDETVSEGIALANSLAPDDRDFLRALSWFGRRKDGSELARFMIQQAAAVIEADGHIREEETRFGIELRDALTRIAQR